MVTGKTERPIVVETMSTKRLGFVFIVTAHMVFNVPSRAEVIGILGNNVTLEFTFNSSGNFLQGDRVAFHKLNGTKIKIAEFKYGKEGRNFYVSSQTKSVSWYKTKLEMNDSGSYFASLFPNRGPAEKSQCVNLTVQELKTNSTVSPINTTGSENEPGVGASYVTILLLIAPFVVFLVALPLLIWVLVCQKDNPPRLNSLPKETVQESAKVSESSLVYSVLDFPMRSSAVLEVNPSDTEYAAVSYLPEMRPV
ncbi:uncharacterized protein LOC142897972 isoform X2 [Nelusetta ayraudi]|uniref:uncharacterized protein LOC142897972 isoform X2 n=1 Tax=Nelusetta ayraudi TaxID=303726 RepID=UPI003F702F4A